MQGTQANYMGQSFRHSIQVDPTQKAHLLIREITEIFHSSVGDHPNFDMLAGAFNMSGRTLRRQLAQAGTSYQRLLDDFRSNHAQKCLSKPHMSIDQIAESLGFSDVANFRHAFKKWTGTSPTAYRKSLQAIPHCA